MSIIFVYLRVYMFACLLPSQERIPLHSWRVLPKKTEHLSTQEVLFRSLTNSEVTRLWFLESNSRQLNTLNNILHLVLFYQQG